MTASQEENTTQPGNRPKGSLPKSILPARLVRHAVDLNRTATGDDDLRLAVEGVAHLDVTLARYLGPRGTLHGTEVIDVAAATDLGAQPGASAIVDDDSTFASHLSVQCSADRIGGERAAARELDVRVFDDAVDVDRSLTA